MRLNCFIAAAMLSPALSSAAESGPTKGRAASPASAKTATARASSVRLTWTYEDFPARIEVRAPKPGKEAYVSETRSVPSLEQSAAGDLLPQPLRVEWNSSTPAVLVVRNDTDKDLYFFAVPHEMNPSHASAGHYFECLCVGRLFHVPAGRTWYRIVRLNLNDSFQKLKTFEINHRIVGVSEADAKTIYKDQLYAGG